MTLPIATTLSPALKFFTFGPTSITSPAKSEAVPTRNLFSEQYNAIQDFPAAEL